MDRTQYYRWALDAYSCLEATCKYSEEEMFKIINWFDGIDGSKERELIGDSAVDAHSEVMKALTKRVGFNLYDSLMIRLFTYAPLILKQIKENESNL
jgi:hypothetical protein